MNRKQIGWITIAGGSSTEKAVMTFQRCYVIILSGVVV